VCGFQQINREIWSQSVFRFLGATKPGCSRMKMGIVMKKL